MKRLLTFALIVFFNLIGNSQETKTDSLLTEKQNAEWFMEFEKLTSETDQINEIKNKIYRDSVFHLSNVNIHNWGYFKVERKSFASRKKIIESNCECKIQFKLVFNSFEHSYSLDYSEFEHTDKILNLINESNIDKITIWKNDKALAIFGERGKCGGIILYSSNRKLKKKIKNVL